LPSVSLSTSQTCCFQIHIYRSSLFGILFSSILCTCPNRRSIYNLLVSVMVGFFSNCIFLYWLISSNFLFYCHILGLQFFYTLSFQKYSFAFCLY
jgi:hypothetical protein